MATTLPPLTINAWLRHDPIMRALAGVPRTAPLLEIGCGQGALGARLAQRFTYTALELDPVSASVARSRVTAVSAQAQVLDRDVRDLEHDERYAAVVAFEVLEHLGNDVAALQHWTSRLQPGGTLVLSVPAHDHRMGPWDRRVGHYRRYDPGQLSSMLSDIGLVDVDETTYGFPIGYVLESVRNLLAGREHKAAETMEDRTSASGRSLQPGSGAGWLTAAIAWPFRWMQRPFGNTRLGTGIVASGRRPT